ncbi:MAG TPA: hypothetical protein VF304_14350 [Casimicrobiaceae bacterium]
MTTARTCQAIVVVLLLVTAAMAYKFIVAGSTERIDDRRVAIVLEPGERALVLGEMRAFVGGLQVITAALSRADMASVAKAAREMGTARSHDVPLALMGKLPLEFKTLAFGVHRGFDTLATEAETIGKPARTLDQLSAILQKCVACHASYAIKDTRAP